MNRDRLSKAFLALSELVSRLRGPGGCPWDAQQTDSTIKMYLLEETYEVMDAVERGTPEEVSMELNKPNCEVETQPTQQLLWPSLALKFVP